MSILTDLRAALEAKAASALDMLSKPGTSGFDEVSWKRAYYRLKHLEDELHTILTDDTIRALLDVAEAAYCENITSCSRRDFKGQDEKGCDVAQCRALTPLVKEVDDGKDAMRQVR